MERLQTFDISKVYDDIHKLPPSLKKSPVIGLTGNYKNSECSLAEGYFTSILKAGGTPFIIPPFENIDSLISVVNSIDGLILTGGGDINPLLLDEEPVKELHSINHKRDKSELIITKLAADRQIPILGICRGIQIMNAAFDGALYQDIHSQMDGTRIKHDQDLDRGYASHTVSLKEESLLSKIFKTDRLAVNSFHHQAVKEPAIHR